MKDFDRNIDQSWKLPKLLNETLCLWRLFTT